MTCHIRKKTTILCLQFLLQFYSLRNNSKIEYRCKYLKHWEHRGLSPLKFNFSMYNMSNTLNWNFASSQNFYWIIVFIFCFRRPNDLKLCFTSTIYYITDTYSLTNCCSKNYKFIKKNIHRRALRFMVGCAKSLLRAPLVLLLIYMCLVKNTICIGNCWCI